MNQIYFPKMAQFSNSTNRNSSKLWLRKEKTFPAQNKQKKKATLWKVILKKYIFYLKLSKCIWTDVHFSLFHCHAFEISFKSGFCPGWYLRFEPIYYSEATMQKEDLKKSYKLGQRTVKQQFLSVSSKKRQEEVFQFKFNVAKTQYIGQKFSKKDQSVDESFILDLSALERSKEEEDDERNERSKGSVCVDGCGCREYD